jgi:hypothetical protein
MEPAVAILIGTIIRVGVPIATLTLVSLLYSRSQAHYTR